MSIKTIDTMDTISTLQRHANMSAIHSKDTKPELIVRRYLWSNGYRYRKNVRRLPGSPDIVLRKFSVVIFVHGCFWHGHSCGAFQLPKTNVEFWRNKIERNKERDRSDKEKLLAMGWNVITVWECQLKPSTRENTLRSIETFIHRSLLIKESKRYELPHEYPAHEEDAGIAAEPDS